MNPNAPVFFRSLPRQLELNWSDGAQHRYLYVWLRDNCSSSRNENGQKTIETFAIPRDISPQHTRILEDGTLEIKWRYEDHTSYYDIEALRRMAEANKGSSYLPQFSQLWDGSITLASITSDYYTVMRTDEGLVDFLQAVVMQGLALVHRVPIGERSVKDLVKRFGFIRQTNYGELFHVRSRLDADNLAYTSLPLSPHTDNPYRDPVPTLQLLQCLVSSVSGGESIFVDGFYVAARLRRQHPRFFQLLAETPVAFQYRKTDVFLEATSTIIGIDDRGRLKHIRLNNRSIQAVNPAMAHLDDFYDAYYCFLSMVNDPAHQLQFKLSPGDLVLFDNERILHGRTGFAGTGKRHLVGCYADRDGLLSTWHVLKQRLAPDA